MGPEELPLAIRSSQRISMMARVALYVILGMYPFLLKEVSSEYHHVLHIIFMVLIVVASVVTFSSAGKANGLQYRLNSHLVKQ